MGGKRRSIKREMGGRESGATTAGNGACVHLTLHYPQMRESNRRRKDGVREAGECRNTGMREGRRKGGKWETNG